LFAGTSGNLSTYDKASGFMAITPTSVAYETMTAEDIVLIKTDGTEAEGIHEPSSEWRMHAAIYRSCPETGAIVHTHSPYATSFAVGQEAIPVILIEMVPFLGGDVRVAQFALPGTEAVGVTALAALEGRNACLMANHGVLAVGRDLAQAHIRAVYVEDAAKIYHLAKQSGEVHCVPEEFIRKMKG
ncbi:MAG: class II aldolase/adducin family protein, partial [Angelakisella sp.]